jgi:hypothetical protein
MGQMCVIDWAACGTWAQVVVGILTVIYLSAAKNAANRQAKAAEVQAKAANESAEATRRQNVLTEIQLENSTSPLLILVSVFEESNRVYYVENQGPGTAHAINWWEGNRPAPPESETRQFVDCTVLGSGYRSRIECSNAVNAGQGLAIECRDGNRNTHLNLLHRVDANGRLFQQHHTIKDGIPIDVSLAPDPGAQISWVNQHEW